MKLKSLKLAAVLFAGFATASCSTDDTADTVGIGEKGFSFRVEADSRATLDGRHIVWESGDAIALALEADGSDETTVYGQPFTHTGSNVFANADMQPDASKTYRFFAIYPYSDTSSNAVYTEKYETESRRLMTAGRYDAGATTLTQSGESASHITAVSPMYWMSDSGVSPENLSVRLHHTTALLDFEVVNRTGGAIEPVSLQFSVPKGRVICGKFRINAATGELVSTGTEFSTSTVKVEGSHPLATGEGAHFYMPVAPFALTAGEKVTFVITTADGISQTIEKTVAKDLAFGAGRIHTAAVEIAEAKLCEYDAAKTLVSGKGGDISLPLTIGDEPCTVSAASSGWIEKAAAATAEAGATATLKFTALANLGPEQRTATVLVTGTQSGRIQRITLTQADGGWLANENSTYALPARFVFNSTTTGHSKTTWTGLGYIRSYMGAGDRNKVGGYISLVRTDENAARATAARTVTSNLFLADAMGEGDCWLFTLPGITCAAGAAFDFYTTMCENAKAPKYYVCEYWDGGEWHCDETSLYTAAEDPNLRYSLKVSGTGTSTSAQYTTFDKSFRLANPLADGSVYIRLRVVGNYAADDTLLDAANRTNSGAGFAKAQFVGANITSLGDKTPTKKLRVLCIGNSFSYYYYTASQLKQLAYREGLELDINAFFKGGQTLQQQLALAHSAYTVSLGGYDIAFVQDQSQNPATFAKNPSANAVINDSCLELVRRIKEASPQCRIILENTWSYPSGTYGGFTSYEEFDRLLAEGTKTMAQNAGAWISPIGQAFAKVRTERPDITLLYTDDKHPAVNGAYLKSCVNCLVLTGKPFGDDAATCDTDAATAAYLRKAAESVVLGHESAYLIDR